MTLSLTKSSVVTSFSFPNFKDFKFPSIKYLTWLQMFSTIIGDGYYECVKEEKFDFKTTLDLLDGEVIPKLFDESIS